MLKRIIKVSALAIILVAVVFAKPTTSDKVESNSPRESNSRNQIQDSVFKAKIKSKKDDRAKILKKFLASRSSPMTQNAEKLVKIADKYNLDWKLLPAIAGVESHYGQVIPQGSYNPYGWNNGGTYFNNWVQASETVASGIRTRYQASGEVTPYNIGPSYAANPLWATHVSGYMNQIDQI